MSEQNDGRPNVELGKADRPALDAAMPGLVDQIAERVVAVLSGKKA